MSHDAFISYKSCDYETAVWLRSVLETNGITCWMAPQDIPGGSSYAKAIPEAIEHCRILVVVISKNTQSSIWVPKELDTAINKGKIVMPFMVDDVPLRDDFNFYLSNVQRYSAFKNKTAAVEKMIAEIKGVLGGSSQETKKRNWLLYIALILSLVLIAAGIAYFSGLFHPFGTNARESEQQVAAESMLHITLIIPANMTVREYNAAQKTLKERLDVLTGGLEYQWKSMDDQIDLLLPASVFADMKVEDALRCYISRPAELYLVDLSDKTRFVGVKRDDIEKVTLLSGTIAGVDPADFGIDTPSYQYIEIDLKDDFMAGHPEIASWQKPVFAQDVEAYADYWFYFHTLIHNGSSFFIINNDLGGRFSELSVYNLTHDPLPDSFSFIIDLNTSTSWQDPLDTAVPGKNQCAREEAEAGSVTFRWKPVAFSAGEKIDTENLLKARLDAIGVPYAFGTAENDGMLTFTVMLPARRISPGILGFLCKNYSLSIEAGLMRTSLPFSDIQADVAPDRSGLILRYSEKKYDRASRTELLKKFGNAAIEDGVPVYISVDDQPLFSVQREDLAEKGIVHITGICVLERNRIVSRPLGENVQWLNSLMKSMLEHPSLPLSLRLDSYQLNADASGLLLTEENFLNPFVYDKASLAAALKSVCPDAQINAKGADVTVFLNLPVNGEFPMKGPEIAMQIYEALDFEHFCAHTLGVCLVAEDNKTRELARIFFTKLSQDVFASDQELQKGSVYVYGILQNGRLTPYREQFIDQIESMPFYQKLTNEHTIWMTE